MSFKIIRGDITKLEVEAIVNAANSSLLGGGGVDGAIHEAAGRRLLMECSSLGGCKTGEAKITNGYNLKAEYVIHTVGPIYAGGNRGEECLLRDCYESCMELVKAHNIQSVAFPLISAGVYGYPKAEAMQIAIEELEGHKEEVILVIFDETIDIPKKYQ